MIAVVLLFVAGLFQADMEPYQRYSAAWATLDAGRVAALYTEAAFYLPPSGDMIRGRAAIEERIERTFRKPRERGDSCRITFELVNRVAVADLRNDIGYYTIVTTDRDGHSERFRGKFLKVWRRDAGGVWRLATDSYGSAPES